MMGSMALDPGGGVTSKRTIERTTPRKTTTTSTTTPTTRRRAPAESDATFTRSDPDQAAHEAEINRFRNLARSQGRNTNDRPPVNVDRVFSDHQQDPETGNRRVTDAYARIGADVNEVINPEGTPDGGNNWNHYATWASNTVGGLIRDDGVPGTDATSDALAEGNREVFQDIAPHMQDFARTFGQDEQFDQEKFDNWVTEQQADNQARTGADNFDADMQQGFENYYRARFETDADAKQELVYEGNLRFAAHEQRYLDDEIDRATDPVGGGVGRVLGQTLVDEVPFFAPDGKGELIEVPTTQDVEGTASPELQQLDSPGARNTVAEFDTNPNSTEGSGAADWSDFDQRMNYLSDLMRVHHNNPSLRDRPANYEDPDTPDFVDNVASVPGNVVGTYYDGAEAVVRNLPLVGDPAGAVVGAVGDGAEALVDGGVDIARNAPGAVADAAGAVGSFLNPLD